MSLKGQIRRGEKWYAWRDRDGNLPKHILKDEHKMKDINTFLESKKETKKKEKK